MHTIYPDKKPTFLVKRSIYVNLNMKTTISSNDLIVANIISDRKKSLGI